MYIGVHKHLDVERDGYRYINVNSMYLLSWGWEGIYPLHIKCDFTVLILFIQRLVYKSTDTKQSMPCPTWSCPFTHLLDFWICFKLLLVVDLITMSIMVMVIVYNVQNHRKKFTQKFKEYSNWVRSPILFLDDPEFAEPFICKQNQEVKVSEYDIYISHPGIIGLIISNFVSCLEQALTSIRVSYVFCQ